MARAFQTSILSGCLAVALAHLPAMAEDETGEAAHDMHAHHHHPVPAGVQRSQATYALPDVTLVDQTGQRVPIAEVLNGDEPILLNFIFTTCTAVCPVMSATFEQVQQGLAEDSGKVSMVSISIDPEQDTPAALAAYAERFDAGTQWRFLTGSLTDSIAVQQAFDAYRGDKMNHAPLTLLRPERDAPWIRFDGFASANDLVAELRPMIGH